MLGPQIKTLYFGGGTPSLFADEYRPIFKELSPLLNDETEITFEANPRDLIAAKLETWQQLRINRLSVGVQSFHPQGLKILTRDHQAADCLKGIELAQKYIENLNIDLIYGWPGQTLEDWLKDLKIALNMGPKHLSLYCLTFAAGTPLGRAEARQKIKACPDELLEEFYLAACELLAKNGYIHTEISNWHQPGFHSQHNQAYWQMNYYLGIGPGAHGFLPAQNESIGLRFAYNKNDRSFLNTELLLMEGEASIGKLDFLTIDERDAKGWLLECIANGIRTAKGVNLSRIEKTIGFKFVTSPLINNALKEGELQIIERGKEQFLVLKEKEWFREQSWSLLVFDCFQS